MNKQQRGQTLLEILIALGASVFILSAIAVVVTTSLSGTQFTKNQNLANQYAQEGLEVVRRIRDFSWANFLLLNNANYCLPQSQTNLTEKTGPNCTPTPNIGVFLREIQIIHASVDCLVPPPPVVSNGSKVRSTVFWSDGKCPGGAYCHKVELATCLHDINSTKAP